VSDKTDCTKPLRGSSRVGSRSKGGHARIESTTTYLHLTTARLRQVQSPLDLISTDRGRLFG
jgi:hypothetical protein